MTSGVQEIIAIPTTDQILLVSYRLIVSQDRIHERYTQRVESALTVALAKMASASKWQALQDRAQLEVRGKPLPLEVFDMVAVHHQDANTVTG
jgi:chromosomal replication initiation ATPase DnaA